MTTYEERCVQDEKDFIKIYESFSASVFSARKKRLNTIEVNTNDLGTLLLMTQKDREAMRIIHEAAALLKEAKLKETMSELS